MGVKMKNVIVMFLLLFNISVLAQTNDSKCELSTSGTLGFISVSHESTSPTYHYSSDGEFHYYILTNFRFGYFLSANFEIEPEVQLLFLEDVDPTYSLNANIAYNFEIDSSNLTPFILAGYGIGNSVPIYGTLLPQEIYGTSDLAVNQINIGAGLKIFVSENIAIRTEYRFQQYKYEKDYSNIDTVAKYTYSLHNLLFGISIFL